MLDLKLKLKDLNLCGKASDLSCKKTLVSISAKETHQTNLQL